MAGVLDRLIALILLMLFAPTLAVVAGLISAWSPGEIILKDEIAMGKGRLIHGYRFRTTGKGSKRFPALGRFLRGYGLDEMPSLWAVVKGEMRLNEFMVVARRRRGL